MPCDPNKHHRRSIRLKEYDYSQTGLYFVTICVQNRECVLGKIIDGKINLSPLGIIADVLWHEIKNHANNVDLGEFTVMPNHIHGIILLGCNDGGDGGDNGGDGGGVIITNTSSETNNRIKIFPVTLFTIPKNGRMTNFMLNDLLQRRKLNYGYEFTQINKKRSVAKALFPCD